jgi:DNA-directed RNA polymerase specialized sigma24 family protein
MACFDGMSIGEISVMLGEPVAAVKESINEALSKLSGSCG